MAGESLHFICKILGFQLGAQPSAGLLSLKSVNDIDQSLGSGTTDGSSFDKILQYEVTVPAGGNVDVDVRALLQLNQAACNAAEGVLMAIEHYSGNDEVVYGPSAANGLANPGFFNAPSDASGLSRIGIKAGGLHVYSQVSGAGWAMDATHKSLNFATVSASNQYIRISFIGRSA